MHTYTIPLRHIVQVGATCLIISSTLFGAVYAYKIGRETSVIFGYVCVLFACSVELLKGPSIYAAVQAFSKFNFVRGLSLLMFGLVSCAYSLTAEISLVSLTRDGLTSHRANVAQKNNLENQRVEQAKQELNTIPANTRSTAELKPLIDAGCGGGVTTCVRLTKLRVEYGRSARREELEKIIANAVTDAPKEDVGSSDPSSTALATYLSGLGVTVAPNIIAQYLNLVPVLALELGSALSILLLNSFGASAPKEEQDVSTSVSRELVPVSNQASTQSNSSQHAVDTVSTLHPVPMRGIEGFVQSFRNSNQLVPNRINNVIDAASFIRQQRVARETVEEKILAHLRMHGGTSGKLSQRQFGYQIVGVNQASLQRACNSLAEKGLIILERKGNKIAMRLAPTKISN